MNWLKNLVLNAKYLFDNWLRNQGPKELIDELTRLHYYS